MESQSGAEGSEAEARAVAAASRELEAACQTLGIGAHDSGQSMVLAFLVLLLSCGIGELGPFGTDRGASYGYRSADGTNFVGIRMLKSGWATGPCLDALVSAGNFSGRWVAAGKDMASLVFKRDGRIVPSSGGLEGEELLIAILGASLGVNEPDSDG